MIRVAAAGDVHFDRHSKGRLAQHFSRLKEQADLFLLAGDLSQTGHPEEITVLAEDLVQCPIPIVAVLGNHDFHFDRVSEIKSILEGIGVRVLDDQSIVLPIGECKVGIVGSKGFGGGFMGACGTEFGEPEMKAFISRTKRQAQAVERHLQELQSDYKLALLHYSPTAQTLAGEKKEIYPFLGSYLLAEAIDRAGADLVFHGHAHHGVEKGETPGGIPVRNVAQPVIRHAFNIYNLDRGKLKQSEVA